MSLSALGKIRKKPHCDDIAAIDIPANVLAAAKLYRGDAVDIKTDRDMIIISRSAGPCAICNDHPASITIPITTGTDAGKSKGICTICASAIKKA
ncbi:hypothetical protein LJC27_01930 [Christensenellaceae bacterium OttesenSCG-928-M15]|nr:hypothetical protein [Christensenellaceae bacterium OttesenSCG-928-M15]